MPIYMMQSGKYTIDYIVAQYEKPFFDPSIPVYEEPVVNPDNHLVITRYDNKFNQLSEVKIPMLQDEDLPSSTPSTTWVVWAVRTT
jgi:hypothetical protein